jgi:GNAT superfamily N-acetyltransferase
MQGEIALCIDRAPDFFALNRLEGRQWHVGVVDAPGGTVAGCIGVAERTVYLRGCARRVMYVGDLKVHPAYRRTAAAGALIRHAWRLCRRIGGDEVPTLITVLGGNATMARWVNGPHAIPQWTRVARLRAHSVGLLWKRRVPAVDGMHVENARASDLGEMSELWRSRASERQFAPAFEENGFGGWISQAPGLRAENYRLLRRTDGRIAAFIGFWDQDAFKRTRVLRYSRALGAFRLFYNLAAPCVNAARLPAAGNPMRYLTGVHLCVPKDRSDMLRALLLASYNDLRGQGYAFLTLGLDVKDPLAAALDGLMAQTTDIDAYVTAPAGRYGGPALDESPLHFEIALV